MAVKEIPFAHLLSNVVDNRGKTCPTSDTGIPLIATNCIQNDILYPAYEKIRFVSKETYNAWFRGHPEPGDLIFVTKGTPGRVCLAPNPVNFCIAQDMVAIRADKEKVYPPYLFAVLRSSEIQRRIENMHVGTLIPHFKKGDFDKLFIPVPDCNTQTLIGDVYLTLSYKIELNHQLNQTLESIARALFKSWFIDFDPVRAKLDGRQPAGMDAETAALFPSGFEDSTLGEIPKGWQALPFEKLFLLPLRNGLTKPKRVRGSGTYMVNMGELFAHRRIGDIEMERVPLTESEAETSMVQTGDLLFARQSLVWSGAGQCSILTEARELRTFESHLIRCRIDPDKAEPWFYFYYFWSTEGRSRIESLIEQVAAAGIRGSDLAKLHVLVPPKPVQKGFREIVQLLESKFAANEQESHTLASIRDSLIPRLLSGEIKAVNRLQEESLKISSVV